MYCGNYEPRVLQTSDLRLPISCRHCKSSKKSKRVMQKKYAVQFCMMSVLIFIFSTSGYSQSNLTDILDKEVKEKESKKRHFVYATFKGKHLVNSRTIVT